MERGGIGILIIAQQYIRKLVCHSPIQLSFDRTQDQNTSAMELSRYMQ